MFRKGVSTNDLKRPNVSVWLLLSVLICAQVFMVEALAKPKLHDQAMSYLREVVNGRTSAFAVAAKNPSPAIRGDISDLLGQSRDAAATTVLGPLAQDADPGVALAARRATARLALTTARQ